MALGVNYPSVSAGTAIDTSNPWSQLLTGAENIAPGVIGSSASGNAANAQVSGFNNAIATQQGTLGANTALWQPQYQTGVGANANLASVLGLNGAAPNYAAFENAPGYQFALSQAQQAIQRQASASGGLYSTTTLNTLGQNAAGYASQNYNNYVQQLLSAANLGTQANQGLQTANTTAGNNISQAQIGIGSANASGILGAAGANSSAVNGGLNFLNSILSGNTNGSGTGVGNNSPLGSAVNNLTNGVNPFGDFGTFGSVPTNFSGDAFNTAFDSSGLNNIPGLDLSGQVPGFSSAGGAAADAGSAAGTAAAADAGGDLASAYGTDAIGSAMSDAGLDTIGSVGADAGAAGGASSAATLAALGPAALALGGFIGMDALFNHQSNYNSEDVQTDLAKTANNTSLPPGVAAAYGSMLSMYQTDPTKADAQLFQGAGLNPMYLSNRQL